MTAESVRLTRDDRSSRQEKKTMRAITQFGYGPPEILQLSEGIEIPEVGDEQVLVTVRASSVNAGDWRAVRAKPLIIRMSGLRRPRSPLIGTDVAGRVEAVGKDVTHLKPGDDVYGMRDGAFAEYVSGKTFVPKPIGISFEEAAAVPVAGLTALQALRDHGGLQAGQRVLVNGAGGGVGTFAVQIAKAFGAEVTAVSKTENLELVSSIGADHVVDYTREDVTRGDSRFDLIVDVGGNLRFAACRRMLNPGGRIVLVGAGIGTGISTLSHIAAAWARSHLLKQSVIFFIAKANTEDLLTLKSMIEAGTVIPVIDRMYPLSETAAALRHVEEGRARGKVVITIQGSREQKDPDSAPSSAMP
jgi:NADPH:quinone reductase-like Zn-dependent oxidoreductase